MAWTQHRGHDMPEKIGSSQGLEMELRSVGSNNTIMSANSASGHMSQSLPGAICARREPSRQTNTSKRAKTGGVFSPLSKRKLEVLEVSQTALQRLTRSHAYELASAASIALNAFFILWETESRAQLALAEKPKAAFDAEEVWFTIAANALPWSLWWMWSYECL